MSEKEVMAMIEKMPIEEKLKLLSEADKAYIRGFIERAVLEHKKQYEQTKTAQGDKPQNSCSPL